MTEKRPENTEYSKNTAKTTKKAVESEKTAEYTEYSENATEKSPKSCKWPSQAEQLEWLAYILSGEGEG